MTKGVLIDNDVVLKVVCYALGDEFLNATTVQRVAPAMLGVGRFVVEGRLKRSRSIKYPDRAAVTLNQLLEHMSFVEPGPDEIALAADLEAKASHDNLDLDSGESQLLAILVHRDCRLLLTGDKRAIVAIGAIAGELAAARVACLEQLIGEMIRSRGCGEVREKVCTEPKADAALAICFRCGRDAPSDADAAEALSSYIGSIAASAGGVLLAGSDLALIL